MDRTRPAVFLRILDANGLLMAMNKLLQIGLGLVIAPMLAGCALPLVVGGAVTTATVMTDRRTTGTIVSDEVVEKRVLYEIGQALKDVEHHITVTSYEGRVLLSGEVPTTAVRRRAEEVAAVSPDVSGVINELAVMDSSSVTTRLSDSMLATKVRTSIIATKQISLNQMKVTVDRGIVYLMGVVTPEEAKTAARVAAEVSGVQKVVTCFSVVSEAEVRRRMKDLNSSGATQSEVRN